MKHIFVTPPLTWQNADGRAKGGGIAVLKSPRNHISFEFKVFSNDVPTKNEI